MRELAPRVENLNDCPVGRFDAAPRVLRVLEPRWFAHRDPVVRPPVRPPVQVKIQNFHL